MSSLNKLNQSTYDVMFDCVVTSDTPTPITQQTMVAEKVDQGHSELIRKLELLKIEDEPKKPELSFAQQQSSLNSITTKNFYSSSQLKPANDWVLLEEEEAPPVTITVDDDWQEIL